MFVCFLYNYLDDLENAERMATMALEYIDTREHIRKVDEHSILYEISRLKLKTKDFDSALKLIRRSKSLRTRKKNDFNWINISSIEFMVCAHLKKFDRLVYLVHHVFSDGNISNYKALYQSWKIREAYCNLLIMAGKIDQEEIERSPIKPLRINKFVNDTEMYNKDKRGLNIAILLVPLIYCLVKKQYGQILDKMDSLRQYSFKYLRKDETLRSNCFIKMILKLPEANYHPLRTARYVKKHKKILYENPAELGMNRTDTEIIPYESAMGNYRRNHGEEYGLIVLDIIDVIKECMRVII